MFLFGYCFILIPYRSIAGIKPNTPCCRCVRQQVLELDGSRETQIGKLRWGLRLPGGGECQVLGKVSVSVADEDCQAVLHTLPLSMSFVCSSNTEGSCVSHCRGWKMPFTLWYGRSGSTGSINSARKKRLPAVSSLKSVLWCERGKCIRQCDHQLRVFVCMRVYEFKLWRE